MIVHTSIEGRPATVAYLHSDWSFATEDTADLVKVIFDDDGEVMFLMPAAKVTTDKGEWNEELHPRGQPENAGQFTSGAGGGGGSSGEGAAPARGARATPAPAPAPKQNRRVSERAVEAGFEPPEVPVASEQEAPKVKISGTNPAAHPAKISPSVTSTNLKIADSENEYVPASVEQMAKKSLADKSAFRANAVLFRNAAAYPMLRPDEVAPLPREEGEEKDAYELRDAHHVVRAVIDRIKEDMRFLIDQASDAQLGAIHWYRGANSMIRQQATHYGLNYAAVAGVFASLSPTKDWDENVYIAKSMIDIFHTKQTTDWDAHMEAEASRIWKPKDRAMVALIRDKTIAQLLEGPQGDKEKAAWTAAKANKEDLVGMWIRTYEQTYGDPTQPLDREQPPQLDPEHPEPPFKHERGYRAFNPDGTLGDFRRNKDGSKATLSQQSIGFMGDAVTAMRSGGDRNIISGAMGQVHKVRSFYNNLVDPEGTDGDVTIDTHAIGAAFIHYKPPEAVAHGLANNLDVSRPARGLAGSGQQQWHRFLRHLWYHRRCLP